MSRYRYSSAFLALVVLAVAILFRAAPAEPPLAVQPTTQTAPTQPSVGLIARTFVLLVLSDDPPKMTPDEAATLQSKHLEHIAAMSRSGKVLVAGPFGSRDDESYRGALLFSCPIDEARAMASEDPAVKAGRLKVICMNWIVPEGAMSFPGETPTH